VVEPAAPRSASASCVAPRSTVPTAQRCCRPALQRHSSWGGHKKRPPQRSGFELPRVNRHSGTQRTENRGAYHRRQPAPPRRAHQPAARQPAPTLLMAAFSPWKAPIHLIHLILLIHLDQKNKKYKNRGRGWLPEPWWTAWPTSTTPDLATG